MEAMGKCRPWVNVTWVNVAMGIYRMGICRLTGRPGAPGAPEQLVELLQSGICLIVHLHITG